MGQNESDSQKHEDTEDQAASCENRVTPPNPTHKNVVEVKVFGRKALRRIRDMGQGPGSGIDGDGDGLTDDGTQYERPATPRNLPRQAMGTWTQYADDITQRRKERARSAIGRWREKMNSATMQYTKEDLLEILKDAKGDLGKQVEARYAASFIFEHDFPNGYRSRVNAVSILDGDADYPGLEVSGTILSQTEDGSWEQIGEFDRTIYPAGSLMNNLDKPGVMHDYLELEDYGDRGRGVGSAFVAASEAMYSEMGLEQIKLTAGLSNGPTVWALDGFDWTTKTQRDFYIGKLLKAIDEARGNGAIGANDNLDLEDILLIAKKEDFDDPERIKPIHIATTEGFGLINQLAGNPGWTGKRAVRNYSRQAAIRDAQVQAEREREQQFQATLRTREEMNEIISDLRRRANLFDGAQAAHQSIYADNASPVGDEEVDENNFKQDELNLADEIEAFKSQTWVERMLRADQEGGGLLESEPDRYPDQKTVDDISNFYTGYLSAEYKKYNQLLRWLFDDLGSTWGGPMEDRLSRLLSALDPLSDTKPDENSPYKSMALKMLDSDDRYRIKQMLAALEYELTDPVQRTTYRGTLLTGKDRVTDILPGDIITDDAFLSTTINPALAANLSRSHDFLPYFRVDPLESLQVSDSQVTDARDMQRTLPKLREKQEATLWQIELADGIQIIPGNFEESEYILPPGIGLEIVSVDRYRSEDPYHVQISAPNDIPSFVRIVARAINLKDKMLDTKSVHVVRFTQQVVAVKTVSVKGLRRIRDIGSGPGSGKDGDGDGLTDDGTQYERPAVPQVLTPEISEQWSAAHSQALARRNNAFKERVARMRKTGKKYRKNQNLATINAAINDEDDAAVTKHAREIFNHDSLGDGGHHVSIVRNIEFTGDSEVEVSGIIIDRRTGRKAGEFSRVLVPNSMFGYGDGDPGVYHELLQLNESARGAGVGRDFLLESEIQYSLSGFKKIALSAGLDSGPWIWARDNYDWFSHDDRESHLTNILRVVNIMAQNGQMSRDLARAYRDLFREALNEAFDDPNRLRPVHFAYMPEFGKIPAIAESNGIPRWRFTWTGIRPVRPYRDMVLESQEEA